MEQMDVVLRADVPAQAFTSQQLSLPPSPCHAPPSGDLLLCSHLHALVTAYIPLPTASTQDPVLQDFSPLCFVNLSMQLFLKLLMQGKQGAFLLFQGVFLDSPIHGGMTGTCSFHLLRWG